MASGDPRPRWLVERPIAHRGLHDARNGIVENSLAAATAAIDAGYAIECDLQRTADGGAVVFHDWTLDRLTTAGGRVDGLTAAACGGLRYKSAAGIIPTFAAFLAHVAGRVPVICEIKSRFDGDTRLAMRAAEVGEAYAGPLAFKSFDPHVIATLRGSWTQTARPLGVVAQADYRSDEWDPLSAAQRHALCHFLHFAETRPDFVSYRVEDLPHAVPFLCRQGIGLPVMTWTVCGPAQAGPALAHADQIIFEGFRP